MQRNVSIESTRNLGLIAHVDAGKTTTTERILYYTGVSSRIGEVDDGAATMDWMTQEQERGITITAASTSFEWRDHYCNLIDLPGHVDFTVEVERSLRVLDGAVVIFCATNGVEPQSEAVWHQADRYRIPRIAFVNKCDRVGANPNGVADAIRKRLRANPLVLQMPHALEEGFTGVIDLVHLRSWTWDEESRGTRYETRAVPEGLREEARLARNIMLEALAEVDDVVMEKFLAEIELSPIEIKGAIRRATLAMRAVPVIMGAARRDKGVQPLLDAIVDYLPSPAEVGPAVGVDAEGHRVERIASDDEPTSALAFKVIHDPVVGQLTYLRVYSGVVCRGDSLLNTSRGVPEAIPRLVKMHANHREDIDRLVAGDIGAAVGLLHTTTGDTLAATASPIQLASMQFSDPVLRVELVPDRDEDDERILAALEKLGAEDPSVRSERDSNSGSIAVWGMGELHIDIIRDRLAREFDIHVRPGKPQVAFRETILAQGTGVARINLGATGVGHEAELVLTVIPGPSGTGTVIDFSAAVLPMPLRTAIASGINEGLERGTVAGFPMVDVRVEVVCAAPSAVIAPEIALKNAALASLKRACAGAEPVLIEPLMAVEVVCPSECVGDVVGDLSARRGKITGIEARLGVQSVAGLVPLASMFGYATDLRSKTQGRATHSMQFKRYAVVPEGMAQKIVSFSMSPRN